MGTAREVRRACGLRHMKVKEVLEMCEKLVLQGRIRGRTPENWHPMGQYTIVKELLYRAIK